MNCIKKIFVCMLIFTILGITNDNHVIEAKQKNQKQHLSILMVGDNLMHTEVISSGRQNDGTYNYEGLFKHIKKDVKAADLSIMNQEVILGGVALGISSYPRFNARQKVGDALAKTGFNMILHATNHALDRGAVGLKRCINYWEKKHPEVQFTGINKSKKQKKKITYFKKNGIKVAVLNYTYGTNGIAMPKNMPYAVNMLSKKKVKRDVKLAKKHADFVMVCPHWGTEYKTSVDSFQKIWTDYFAKLGVDLVIGTHPHVCEPVKWVKEKKGHKMLVYYSLGNYINSSVKRAVGVQRQYYGGMAKVQLKRNKSGKVVVDTAKFVPLITHKKNGKVTTYKVCDYSKKKALNNDLRRQDPTFSYPRIYQFFRNLISKKFLSI